MHNSHSHIHIYMINWNEYLASSYMLYAMQAWRSIFVRPAILIFCCCCSGIFFSLKVFSRVRPQKIKSRWGENWDGVLVNLPSSTSGCIHAQDKDTSLAHPSSSSSSRWKRLLASFTCFCCGGHHRPFNKQEHTAVEFDRKLFRPLRPTGGLTSAYIY